jgi:hypothetical protein
MVNRLGVTYLSRECHVRAQCVGQDRGGWQPDNGLGGLVKITRCAARLALAVGLAIQAAGPQHAHAQEVRSRETLRSESVAADRPASTSDAARREYEGCQARDEAEFRSAIERVTAAALQGSIRGLDYLPIVSEAWRKGNVDEVMARRVDTVLTELKQETSWSELISSLASRETQEKLAKAAAERVYGSAEMRQAIETLAVRVGRVVGERLELATTAAAEPTTRCLEVFLGPRYGTTVARIVATDAGREFAIDVAKGTATVSGGSVLAESKEGLAGLVAIIMRRQLGNLSARVGQRLVGAVLGRVVSVVAGGIGVVLIAKDIWELRNGVLPIIASEMKAPATLHKVQGELAQSVATEIETHIKDIARRTSERVIEIWHEFRRAHGKVLELTERNAAFKAFIDNVSPHNLARLDEVVALQLPHGGETRLLARVADGTLAEAVERWPTSILEIARDARSLEAGFKWRALAGDARAPKVLDLELHRLVDPDRLTRTALERLLLLDDRVASRRLAALSGRGLEPLLEVGDVDLKRLARALGETELASLSSYLTTLERPASQRLLAAVAKSPTRMQALSSEQVRAAILASRDQSAALDIMLRSGELLDLGDFIADVNAARSGDVSPRLLVWRYPGSLIAIALLGTTMLLVLWRAVAGRRPGKPEKATKA